ncbi:MAG: hypothetical protein JNK05_04905 [Myxococcales bacterium]|nr:hypothetical protein [Myxococcales bacterium]
MSNAPVGGPPPVRTIAFNSMPATTRQRFVDVVSGRSPQKPILSQPSLTVGGGVGWLVTAVFCVMVVFAMMSSASQGRYSSSWLEGLGGLVAISLTLWLAFFGVFAAVKRFNTKGALPFQAGKYLFATDLVVAESDQITLVPMGLMKNFNGVHQHYNGVYTHTDLHFHFQGYGTVTFAVKGKHVAEQALDELAAMTRAISDAAKNKDVRRLRDLDVFHDAFASGVMDKPGLAGLDALVAEQSNAQATGPLAREIPKFFKWGWAASLVAALVSAVPSWTLAAKAGDRSRLADAIGPYSSTYQLEDYVRRGGDETDLVATEIAPLTVYREALRRNSVTSLRDFVRTNPNSRYVTEARGLIRETFVRVRRRFDEQAATDPQMRAFMTALLGYLESNDSPPVSVRFRPPTSDALSQIDARLTLEGRRMAGRDIVAIAPHFTEATSGPREREITQNLSRGFGAVFPNDVLRLQDGVRIVGESPTSVTEPTIEVGYVVRPSGSFYSLRTGNRAFVGIVVDFAVLMRVPGSTQTFTFTTSVQPPERFSFSYDTYGGASAGPSDGRVYTVMAERAFDQLSEHMAGVFFRSGTEAHRSLQGTATTRSAGTNP